MNFCNYKSLGLDKFFNQLNLQKFVNKNSRCISEAEILAIGISRYLIDFDIYVYLLEIDILIESQSRSHDFEKLKEKSIDLVILSLLILLKLNYVSALSLIFILQNPRFSK